MFEKNIVVSQVVDFKNVTPKMLTEVVKVSSLYKKAFLSTEEKSTTEYAQNTTTWD